VGLSPHSDGNVRGHLDTCSSAARQPGAGCPRKAALGVVTIPRNGRRETPTGAFWLGPRRESQLGLSRSSRPSRQGANHRYAALFPPKNMGPQPRRPRPLGEAKGPGPARRPAAEGRPRSRPTHHIGQPPLRPIVPLFGTGEDPAGAAGAAGQRQMFRQTCRVSSVPMCNFAAALTPGTQRYDFPARKPDEVPPV
jgi:hypothetical protein